MDGVALLLCCIWTTLVRSTVQEYVDGLKQNLSLNVGQCAASSSGRTAEWRVDLGEILSIHHIFVQYMTDNEVWDAGNWNTRFFLGFSVYISNSTNKRDGVLCFRDTNYTPATIPNPVNITGPYHGRYVIYYNNRTHKPYPKEYFSSVRTNLCEVEVHGCSTPGYYGENCSIPCPQNCLERRCHITYGNCLGCLPGYHGKTGSLGCPQYSSERRYYIADGTCFGCKLGYNIPKENLALRKQAWQSNVDDFYITGSDLVYLGADRAVDGRKQNLALNGGQCASSGSSPTAEWRVDLQGITSIYSISIQYMTGNRVWGLGNSYTSSFLGFSVFISNTTKKEEGVLCFRDTNYTRTTIPNPLNIICPYHGRYVIYYNNRTHKPYPDGYSALVWSNLCEVEVYGFPKPGYYGNDCSIPCPQNYQGRYCHITEENYLGCLPGYYGENCSIPCPQNCLGRHCHIIYGICLGCKLGNKGQQCFQVHPLLELDMEFVYRHAPGYFSQGLEVGNMRRIIVNTDRQLSS